VQAVKNGNVIPPNSHGISEAPWSPIFLSGSSLREPNPLQLSPRERKVWHVALRHMMSGYENWSKADTLMVTWNVALVDGASGSSKVVLPIRRSLFEGGRGHRD